MKSQTKNPKNLKKWGDEEDDETAELDKEKEDIVDLDDGSQLVTITVYTLNENGQRVKKVTKIKRVSNIVKINKRVEERKKWKKFGECANVPFGRPEKGITEIGEEFNLELSLPGITKKNVMDSVPKPKSDMTLSLLRSFTQKVQTRAEKLESTAVPASTEGTSRPTEGSSEGSSKTVEGKYVPPQLRSSSGGRRGETDEYFESPREKRDEPTVHLTGLSEDTKDQDIHDLCSAFGPVKRVYLGKNKNGKAKGFAYVTYRFSQDAQQAIEKLDGHGFNYLIIRAEWAKPSNK